MIMTAHQGIRHFFFPNILPEYIYHFDHAENVNTENVILKQKENVARK